MMKPKRRLLPRRFFSRAMFFVFVVILLGFLFPENPVIPVQGASSNDWNKDSFWYEPWGASGVHKGIDIFAEKGRPLIAATNMLVIYKGRFSVGGNVILGLGPKWRIHYYAHLDNIEEELGLIATTGSQIGSVGDSGNAQGKQPHLHYSILSLIPLPWRVSLEETQGLKKAFYIDPAAYLLAENN